MKESNVASPSKTVNTFPLVLAILALAFVSQINTIASVMLADISASLNITDPTLLQYVMQFGMIGGFPISLAMTLLTRRFRTKPMMLIGLVFIIVGGLIPIISHDTLTVLYVGAFLVGFGQGFVMALLGGSILLNFKGAMQNRMLGLNTTFSTGGAAILLVLAGWLCQTGWVNVYFIYFLAIPVFFITLFCLPMDPKPQEIIAAEAEKGGSKAPLSAAGVITCLLRVPLMIAYAVFPLNINLFLVAEGIGGAVETGISMSIVTIVGALAGLVLPQFIKAFKFQITTAGAVCGLIATVLAMMSKNIVMVYIASAFDGLFFGLVLAGAGYVIGRICTPSQFGPTFSFGFAMSILGTIFCPMIVNSVTSAWSGVDMAAISAHDAFLTAAVVFGASIVLSAAWSAYLTKKFPEKAEETEEAQALAS